MNLDSPVFTLKDQSSFLEVINAEKHLWELIHSKGLLHTEVQVLYRKARSGYENIILNDLEGLELQDVEYSLWKLHYKHINEFRNKIRQTPAKAEGKKSAISQNVVNMQSSVESHMELFKSFLSEAIEFYHNLMTKLGKHYGLPEDPLYYEKVSLSCAVESTKLQKCQYSCHRLLVCLGDLARYRELCKKPDFLGYNWSIAATYYFEATLVWPNSGGPQNQLALLATYIGDDFVALYHCIRSLAIKEPFPDAWNNLILLFEKNRSSHLHSLSKEAHFNFLNPSKRNISLTESPPSGDSLNNDIPETAEQVSSTKCDLWPLFVRMMSSFFIESSLDEFSHTFASTVRELDVLLALDDSELKATLECYQHMNSERRGPYRVLQMVSVLIFVIDNMTQGLTHKQSKETSNVRRPIFLQPALTAAFICLGRLVERCLRGNSLESSPLLPAVLVFVEWLVGMLDNVETYGDHEKVRSAASYFFYAFASLLNQLDKNEDEGKTQDHTALWEDIELRGFAPIACAHGLLDFTTTHPKPVGNVDCGNVSRANRVLLSAMQIVGRSGDSQKWIFYNKRGRKFCPAELKQFQDHREVDTADSSSDLKVKESQQHGNQEAAAKSSSDLEVKQPHQHRCATTKETGEDTSGENQSHPSENGKLTTVEEEEVILFKPIARYNSAPLHTYVTNDEMSTEGIKDQRAPSDECLRRATSLCMAQNQTQADPLSFCSKGSNFRSDNLFKDTATYPTGPPSLNAWVLNRENSNIERDRRTRDFFKPRLSPIDEIASTSLTGLSICETNNRVSATASLSPAPYSAPLPSAPLLPEDATWFTGNPSSFSEYKSSGNIKDTEDGILGASPPSSHTKWSDIHEPLRFGPSVPGFSDGYQPIVGMSSSEWLRHYTYQHLDRASSQVYPVHHFYAPGSLGNSRFDLYDRWGNPLSSNQMVYLENPQLNPGSPLIYGADEQRRERFFHGYQRPSPYECGAFTDLRVEHPQLLQYLKEKDWQLQRQSQVRGPKYMGN